MKKISIIALLALTSCVAGGEHYTDVRDYRNEDNLMGEKVPVERITHFTYRSHDYIRFDCGLGAKTSSVVHDPDCTCHGEDTN